ncbi:MAG TPA: cysteine--tRNA ligase, partial [Sulfurimonas autotrophica]|nr:cysteine--tRNA ligase [Sulfurimonas autotrophica]
QFGVDETTKKELDALIEQRDEAKKAKDFATSDALREQILSYGVNLMDTPQGTFWEKV